MSRPSERVIPQPKASRPAVGIRARTAATPLNPAVLGTARIVELREFMDSFDAVQQVLGREIFGPAPLG